MCGARAREEERERLGASAWAPPPGPVIPPTTPAERGPQRNDVSNRYRGVRLSSTTDIAIAHNAQREAASLGSPYGPAWPGWQHWKCRQHVSGCWGDMARNDEGGVRGLCRWPGLPGPVTLVSIVQIRESRPSVDYSPLAGPHRIEPCN